MSPARTGTHVHHIKTNSVRCLTSPPTVAGIHSLGVSNSRRLERIERSIFTVRDLLEISESSMLRASRKLAVLTRISRGKHRQFRVDRFAAMNECESRIVALLYSAVITAQFRISTITFRISSDSRQVYAGRTRWLIVYREEDRIDSARRVQVEL